VTQLHACPRLIRFADSLGARWDRPQSGHRRAFVTVSRGKATFRKSDVERGIKALENAGLKVARVEISREGNITLIPEDDSTATTNENQDLRDLV
jgi:hypothetical protein